MKHDLTARMAMAFLVSNLPDLPQQMSSHKGTVHAFSHVCLWNVKCSFECYKHFWASYIDIFLSLYVKVKYSAFLKFKFKSKDAAVASLLTGSLWSRPLIRYLQRVESPHLHRHIPWWFSTIIRFEDILLAQQEWAEETSFWGHTTYENRKKRD
jgi:hypothetical protein